MYKNKRSVPLFKRVHGALFDFRPTMRLLAVPVGRGLAPAVLCDHSVPPHDAATHNPVGEELAPPAFGS